ncbi:MAG: VTT domain-containing protein [Faecalibacterium sp.]|jgi:uncharacterized membrane protein YdjX (TVP38/TMEM64 family)|nr:VTT domain-containing protein [Faecalibacterium sp.]
MSAQLAEWYALFTSLAFWEGILDAFQNLGPLVPIALAALESLIPALPLVAIVTLNVAGHGALWGLLYSWVGTCVGCTIVFLFFRLVFKKAFVRWAERSEKVKKARDWVNGFNPAALFLIAILPFTPSSFVNFAFGISDFAPKKYLLTMYGAKLIMISLLALFGKSCVEALDNPLFIVLAVALILALYAVSVKVRKKNGL